MGGIDSLFFLKVLCDLERKKIDTVPDDELVKEVSLPTEVPDELKTSPYVVKVYMQKEYGVGGSVGSKRYACPKCSCLFRHKRHLRQHLQFHCHHKCLGCSECYTKIWRSFQEECGEKPKHPEALTCSTCPSSFLTLGGLAVHKECHPQSDEVFQCRSCSEQFNNGLDLAKHQKTHLISKQIACIKCFKTFSSYSNRRRHMRLKHPKKRKETGHHFMAQLNNHSNEEEYGEDLEEDDGEYADVARGCKKECALCYQQFKNSTLNRSHTCSMFPSPEDFTEEAFKGHFECPACSQLYSSYIALKLHWGSHLGHEPLSCTNCDKTFATLRRVDEHFELHGKNTCEKCGVFFYKRVSLVLHHCGYTQRCFTCDRAFPSRSSYVKHQHVHPLPKTWMYKCTECKKSFMKESYFRAHQIEHTGTQPFQCSVCNEKFLMFGPFKKHVMTHFFLSQRHQCGTCKKSFQTANGLKAHCATHLANVKCEECHATFETVSSFKSHKCEVSKETQNNAIKKDGPNTSGLQCEECQTLFEASETHECQVSKETKNSIVEDSLKLSGFQCEECNMVFRKQYQLFIHLRDGHGKPPPYLLFCDLCSKGFYHRLHLQSHRPFCLKRNDEERKQTSVKKELEKRTKLGGRQFHCTQCGKKYFTQKKLDEHMYVHKDPSECPFQCPKCGAGYAREYYLQSHMEKCDSDKNSVKCTECGAMFLNEKTLERHKRVHGNELECDLCHAKFITKRGYEKHQSLCTPESAQYKTFRKPTKLPAIYTCPNCDRTYKLKHRFDAHIALHQGIMQYQCPTCFHKFMSSNNFKRHKCSLEIKSEVV